MSTILSIMKYHSVKNMYIFIYVCIYIKDSQPYTTEEPSDWNSKPRASSHFMLDSIKHGLLCKENNGVKEHELIEMDEGNPKIHAGLSAA